MKARPDGNGKLAATGFCFGGSMANNLSVILGADLGAAAPFYGGAPKPEDVSKIKAAILIHHGALDKALRLALEKTYPALHALTLRDYKVRILESAAGTGARTRVLIESGDGQSTWGTVGVSDNIIDASWEALVDAVNFKLTM